MKRTVDEIFTDVYVKLNKATSNEFPDYDKQTRTIEDYLGKYHDFSSNEASLFTLKTLNLILARYHSENMHSLLASRPFSLVVDPCGACNLRCPGCIHISPYKEVFSWPNVILSMEKYCRFLKEFGPCATHISFYHSGEPLLNPMTPEFIRKAKNYLLTTVMSTNLCVASADMEGIVRSGLDYMIVCIDGASQETYGAYRKNGNFDGAISNLRRLISTKRRLQSYSPYIVWQFLVFKHNAHEIDKAGKLAQKIGVNEFAAVKPYPVNKVDPSIQLADNVKYKRMVFEYDFDLAKKNLNNARSDLNAESLDIRFPQIHGHEEPLLSREAQNTDICQWVYKSISMDAAGRILPCCRPPFKTEDLVFADVMDGGNIYNSKKYQLVRQYFAHKDSIHECIDLLADTNIPFCFICKDKQITLQDTHNVRDYLKTASLFNMLSDQSVRLLTDW